VRCVHQSYDHAEAEIIAGLLREEGCTAFVFENGLSRLEWYRVIAFGGPRVMVPDTCFAHAHDVLDRWRRGDYRLECEDQCPRCHGGDIEENPNYRGWAFVLPFLISLPLLWPLKWRMRCKSCGLHWKVPPKYTYAVMAAAVHDAEMNAHDQ
jgi:hypothetical protein